MRTMPADSQARLYRSHAPCPAELSEHLVEQVGQGRLEKMVRIAIADPDGEVWRYSIRIAGHMIHGDDIPKINVSWVGVTDSRGR